MANSLFKKAIVTIFILIFVWTPFAVAVVKDVTLVGSQGEPLSSATVTIVFPDGTEEEEETDDKGILIFDFPGSGDYVIKDSSGATLTTVSIPLIPTKVKWAAAGVVGAGIIVAVANDSDSDQSAIPSLSEIAGNYQITGDISNPSVSISVIGNDIIIHSTADMTGPYNASGAFTATGTITGAPPVHPITETVEGQWSRENGNPVLTGTLTYTPSEGESHVYNVVYTKIS